jgi:hypothetical protein
MPTVTHRRPSRSYLPLRWTPHDGRQVGAVLDEHGTNDATRDNAEPLQVHETATTRNDEMERVTGIEPA